MSEKHTPGPVRCDVAGSLVSDRGQVILTMFAEGEIGHKPEEYAANCKFVERAWNTHKELLAACEAARTRLEKIAVHHGVTSPITRDALNAVIAKAKPPEEPVPTVDAVLRKLQRWGTRVRTCERELNAIITEGNEVLAETGK